MKINYYVTYAYKAGFGFSLMEEDKKATFATVKKWANEIKECLGEDNVIIMSWVKIEDD